MAAADPYAMTVLWTATGDDADTGRASRYELRYSANAVGGDLDGWWSAASSAPGLPRPSSAGMTDSTTIAGLHAETTYSLVLRVYDEAGNASAYSNVLVAATGSEIPATPSGCNAPAVAPGQFRATEDAGAVLLAWAPTGDPAASALHVWRAAGQEPLSFLASVDPAQSTYRDTGVRAGRAYRYRLTYAVSCGDGPATGSRTVTLSGSASPVTLMGTPLATVHAYPNPAQDQVHFVIHVEDPAGQNVRLRLFDLTGKVVADIAEGSYPPGDTVVSWSRVAWNGNRVAPGYYESIGTVGEFPVRERLVLLP